MLKVILFIASVALLSTLVSGQSAECLKAFRSASLSLHNAYRRNHSAPALSQDPVIDTFAQNYARHLATVVKTLVHNKDAGANGYGENLAYIGGTAYATTITITQCTNLGKTFTKMWYDEVSKYNFAQPGFSYGTGHFTQLVWKSSSKVGFGLGQFENKVFAVANYYKARNINTAAYFAANVSKTEKK